ncbi:DUF4097 family beta strand repeat-containing protein [Oceanobacillus sp. FSL H7-0719]|uniref:DUF4097 family beta strand repeat-containing protein n=1 Tax=Oceanobacillus sp. FSL H7-0719 TaxID=2954507 RepID=UPI00324CA7E1
MNKQYISIITIIIMFLTGCGSSDERQTQMAEIDDIDTIYIEHGSDNLLLKSADQPNVEASYGERGVTLDKSDGSITLGIKNRMIKIGPKLNLDDAFQVTIPNDYKGDIVISGDSGEVSSDELTISGNLDVKTKSGDISVAFAEIQSDIQVVAASGKVELILNEEQPDVQLKSKTKSGSNTIIIPISLNESEGGKEIEGISGEGTYVIDIETTSGDVTVKSD